MKSIRRKLVTCVFIALLACNGLLVVLGIRYPDSSVITVTSRVVLLPALPILFLFPVPLSAGDDYTWDYEVGAVLSFFSSLAWSMIVGFVFRHDRNA